MLENRFGEWLLTSKALDGVLVAFLVVLLVFSVCRVVAEVMADVECARAGYPDTKWLGFTCYCVGIEEGRA